MSIIKNIQNKPRAEKIKIMWFVAGTVFVLLIIVWVLSYRFHKKTEPDTTLFDAVGKGVSGAKDNYGK